MGYTNILRNKRTLETQEHPSMPKSSLILKEFEEVEGKTRFEELKESLKMEIGMLKPCYNKRMLGKIN